MTNFLLAVLALILGISLYHEIDRDAKGLVERHELSQQLDTCKAQVSKNIRAQIINSKDDYLNVEENQLCGVFCTMN